MADVTSYEPSTTEVEEHGDGSRTITVGIGGAGPQVVLNPCPKCGKGSVVYDDKGKMICCGALCRLVWDPVEEGIEVRKW